LALAYHSRKQPDDQNRARCRHRMPAHNGPAIRIDEAVLDAERGRERDSLCRRALIELDQADVFGIEAIEAAVELFHCFHWCASLVAMHNALRCGSLET